MTANNQHANHQLFTPLLQASKVNQTLLSDILTNQNQFMISSLNRVLDHAEQLLTAAEPQAAVTIQQSLFEQQHNQFTEYSQQLFSSFQQAQANYQNLFISAVQANESQPSAVSVAKEKPTTAKTINAATKTSAAKTNTAKKSSAKSQPPKAAPAKVSGAKSNSKAEQGVAQKNKPAQHAVAIGTASPKVAKATKVIKAVTAAETKA